jgi:hypothetical protein
LTDAVPRPGVAALAVTLAMAGGYLTGRAIRETPAEAAGPPSTSAVQRETQPSAAPPSVRPPARPATSSAPRRSAPVRLDVPSIGVHTRLIGLGLQRDGTVEVPPLDSDAPAGWYEHSAMPGEVGGAVILGHVDTAREGPAVFHRLAALEAGADIAVRRADGSTVHFTVTRVARYPKSRFPTQDVYGPADYPALRLVTCGGSFDRSRGSYRDNIVVSARMV